MVSIRSVNQPSFNFCPVTLLMQSQTKAMTLATSRWIRSHRP